MLIGAHFQSWRYHSNPLFYSYSPEYSAHAAAFDSWRLHIHFLDLNDAPGQLLVASEALPSEVPFYQFCIMFLAHRPSNDFSRIGIEHSSKKEPPFSCVNGGKIGQPLFIRCVSGKILLRASLARRETDGCSPLFVLFAASFWH
jgi:hypothetical protein